MATEDLVTDQSPALRGETFLHAPRCKPEDVREGQLAVVGVPHDITKISRRGAREGPRALREATFMLAFAVDEMAGGEVLDIDRNLRFRRRPGTLVDVGDVSLNGDVNNNISAIRGALERIVANLGVPVTLGGDHFITYPVVSGVAAARERSDGADLAYLHVDMHLDLADDVAGFGRFASGTPVRRLVEDGVLDPARIVIWGAESFQHCNEWQFAKEAGITVISAASIERVGPVASIQEALERAVSGADGLYLSMDIDVLARVYAPGTGNAAGANGLSPRTVLELMRFIRDQPFVGIDLVEVAPRWDPTGVTAGLGAALLIELIWPRLFDLET